MQAPVPDARAGELRTRLLVILSSLTNGNASGQKPDQKTVDQYAQWTKEYEEWLKGAARSYAN
jgi:hypothetical protein